MELQTIQAQLKKLRLPTAARELENVLQRNKKAASLDWIFDLFEREIDARAESSLNSRLKKAKFPELTTMESFDFAFNASIDEEKVRKLSDLSFVNQNRIALFLGNPGTGKTHIAIAIGVLAVRAGYQVHCTSLKRLSHQIRQAKLRNSLDDLFRRMLVAKLWIIDDWGVVTLQREIAEEVFDLLDRRKHSSAMILTSNRDIDEWPQVFPDPVIANATIDRIFDRAETLIFKGDSYRLKGKIQIRDIDAGQIKH
jgi:DNA replication protein DnaC